MVEFRASNAALVDEYDSLRVKYHLEPEPKPSVETFVRTRAEYDEKEICTLIHDLCEELIDIRVKVLGGRVFSVETKEAQAKLDEIKYLLERRWNDEKILDFIEENDL